MNGYIYALWIVVGDLYIVSLCGSSEKGRHSRVNHFIPYPYNVYSVKKLKGISKYVLYHRPSPSLTSVMNEAYSKARKYRLENFKYCISEFQNNNN